MEIIPIIVLFIFGAIGGSFLNVLIYRLPRNESILTPASHCPQCQQPLRIRDNIPIISYLLLGAKCHYCRATIPIQYFLVELISALSWIALYLKFGLSLSFALHAILISILIICNYTDLHHRRILNPVLASGFGIGLGLILVMNPSGIPASILGMTAGLAFMLFWAVVGKFLFKQTALGGGDIKLAAVIGVFTGAKFVILILFLSFCLAAIYVLLTAPTNKKIRGTYLPLAPFITIATLVTVLFGNELLQRYLELIF
jgi:leader peptidase (prepilin peptidase)/N-methyltransferase